jgi:hypothetical protein
MGDLNESLSWLATSFARRETDNIIAAIDWPFAPYRNDRRFQDLLAKAVRPDAFANAQRS